MSRRAFPPEAMNITPNIEARSCSACGCGDLSQVEWRTERITGRYIESVEFDCGLKLRYCAGFGRVEQAEECRQSPRAKAWREYREVLAEIMVEEAKKHAGVPDADLKLFVRRLVSDLDCYRDEFEQVPNNDQP